MKAKFTQMTPRMAATMPWKYPSVRREMRSVASTKTGKAKPGVVPARRRGVQTAVARTRMPTVSRLSRREMGKYSRMRWPKVFLSSGMADGSLPDGGAVLWHMIARFGVRWVLRFSHYGNLWGILSLRRRSEDRSRSLRSPSVYRSAAGACDIPVGAGLRPRPVSPGVEEGCHRICRGRPVCRPVNGSRAEACPGGHTGPPLRGGGGVPE